MKTTKMNLLNQNKLKGNTGASLAAALIFLVLLFAGSATFAHCDTMDGPLIADARKAITDKNVNYVLKWVPIEQEKEIKHAFELAMKVRELGPEARELSESYFFDTLVRIHRMGEGVPFTGVKPSGSVIDERILAADRSIALGNLTPLKGKVPSKQIPELKERFEKVIALKNFDVNDVKAGREYIEAYVQFFKYAEGETEDHHLH